MEPYILRTGAYMTNTYIIITNCEAVVIDPGDGIDDILSFLDEKGASPAHVLLTHTHFDHIGGVAALRERGAKVYVSERDYRMYVAVRDLDPAYNHVPSFEADVFVKEGDKLELCGNCYSVISVPGHTPGGVCYFTDETLFSGDTLFRSSVGRTDLAFGDSAALLRSLKKLLLLPDGVKVYPGHGPSTTVGFERRFNPYASN